MNYDAGTLVERTRDWTAPVELTLSPPREVRYRWLGIFLMVLAVAMMAGGAAFSYFMLDKIARGKEHTRLLNEQGAESTGKVTRLWRGGDKERPHLLAYEFQAGEKVVHGSSRVPGSLWESLTVGQDLPIRYVPSDPLVNRPVGVSRDEPPVWLVMMLPAVFAGGAFLMVYRLRRQRRLLEEGRAAAGVITKSFRTKNGRSLRFEYLLQSGGVGKGRGTARRAAKDVGAVITVVYDPEQPNRAEPYPFDLVKIVR